MIGDFPLSLCGVHSVLPKYSKLIIHSRTNQSRSFLSLALCLQEDRPPAGMVRTPGRPISPVAHPRTRPEAMEIALKHKKENDWMRHDGKNIEPPPPGHVRLTVS